MNKTTPRSALKPQLPDSSIEEFEAALIKARDAWQSKGARSPRLGPTGTYSVRAHGIVRTHRT
jgi:hypothetical protein